MHSCEFFQRIQMYSAQLVEVKGEINLESVQIYSGSGSTSFPSSMEGNTGYCPPPPQSGFGGDMAFCPPPPQSTFGNDMSFCPPPPQPTFNNDFNTGYEFPSAPSFTVCINVI